MGPYLLEPRRCWLGRSGLVQEGTSGGSGGLENDGVWGRVGRRLARSKKRAILEGSGVELAGPAVDPTRRTRPWLEGSVYPRYVALFRARPGMLQRSFLSQEKASGRAPTGPWSRWNRPEGALGPDHSLRNPSAAPSRRHRTHSGHTGRRRWSDDSSGARGRSCSTWTSRHPSRGPGRPGAPGPCGRRPRR